MASLAPLSCPKCQADLGDEIGSLGSPQACPSCKHAVEGLVFPAHLRAPATGKSAELLVAAEHAGCFYHPQSRAEVPCDLCGRFLCALCDVNLQRKHLCPSCVNSANKKKQIKELDGDRVLYGGIAMMVALLPLLLFWPLTIITGPLTVFIALYGWRKPQSITGTVRSSYIVAILLGLVQTVVWLIMGAAMFKYL